MAPDATEKKVRQGAPSTAGQIAPEAWKAMSEAAERAGMPLDQWLRGQLLGTTAAGTAAPAPAEAAGGVAELQRRIEQLTSEVGRLGNMVHPDTLPSNTDDAHAAHAATGYADAPYTPHAGAANAGTAHAGMTRPAMAAGAYAPMAASAYAPEEPAPVAAPPARPASTGSAYADQRLQEAIHEIDQRLASMHLIPPRTETPRTAPPSGPVTANAIEAAVAEIAARQNELDSAPRRRTAEAPAREPAPREPYSREPVSRGPYSGENVGRESVSRENLGRENLGRENPAREPRPAPARRESAPRDAISERFVRDPFAAGGFPPRAASTPTPALAPAAPAMSSAAVQTAVGDALSVLQGELGGMRQSLATLAPRRAVDELQRVVQQLADRVERSGSRDEDLRSTLVALRDMIGGLKLPEHPALLLGRIDALERKLDIVNAKMVDGATVARLQAQAGEIRELLARTLSSDSVRLLAEQVSMLATKVSDMAANEDRAFRTAVGSLERRLDTLADKIGNQPAPVIPLDDLVGRLDAIQTSLASARRELPAGMETMIKGLSERIERIERPISIPDNGPRLDDLSRQIGELTQRIEKAVAGAEIAGQLSSIERGVNDLFIQMEETRATFLAGSHPRPPGNGGNPNGGARIRREIAAVEAKAPTASAPTASAQTAPVAAAPMAAMPAVSAAPAPAAEAVATSPAEPVVEASFTPPPASIPKPFEPQLMRAALEELNRSAGAAAALGAGPVAAGAPASVPSAEIETTDTADIETADTPHSDEPAALDHRRDEASLLARALEDEFDFRPVDLDAQAAARGIVPGEAPAAATGAPSRAAFIAQARRAAQPAGTIPPELRSHIADRHRRQPTRWLARIRAMLLIGLCGSALAYGSWHLLTQLRDGQLRAFAPTSSATATLPPAARPAPTPDDVTGSIGKAAPRPQPPAGLPANPQGAPVGPAAPVAPIGPSSMSLPTELPGGIASQALRAAALGGDPGAAFEIARRFMDGEGVAPSAARAAEWYAYASANGSVPATYRLGMIYEKGMDGVPRDVAKARQLYVQAADAGNVSAMHNLGVLLASGVDNPPDYRNAAAWFTRAAEHGVRDSQYNLAVLYARGFGVAMNPPEAWRWFALAAAGGDGEAAAKRDEIGDRLDPRTLAAVRQEVEGWTPQVVDALANDSSATGWNDGMPRKTASR